MRGVWMKVNEVFGRFLSNVLFHCDPHIKPSSLHRSLPASTASPCTNKHLFQIFKIINLKTYYSHLTLADTIIAYKIAARTEFNNIQEGLLHNLRALTNGFGYIKRFVFSSGLLQIGRPSSFVVGRARFLMETLMNPLSRRTWRHLLRG